MYFNTPYSLAASLTLVLFMPCSVSAAPWARRDLDGGLQVSLPDRLSPTNDDGTFNHTAAIRLNYKTLCKHQANLHNLQENTDGLPEGMKIIDVASLTRQATAHVRRDDNPFIGGTHALRRRFKKEGAGETLTDVGYDTEWKGNILVGDPGQDLQLDFDTGSSDLWVINEACTTGPCAKKTKKYDPSKSDSSERQPGTFTIQYGDKSTVSGPIYTDEVTITGITVKNQALSAVTELSEGFLRDPISGIIGLAWPDISNLKKTPWFLNAVEQGVIKKREFGFYLSKKGSELYLGGTDPKHYEGTPEYHEVDSKEGFWKVKNARIHLGEEVVLKEFPTIIDSGTTLMYGPPDAVKEFYSKVEGAKVYDGEQGFYTFPCDKVPEVAFSWDEGKKFVIPPEHFNLGTTEEGSSSCIGALAASDIGLGKAWLLGDILMKSLYAAFRFGEKEINKGAVVGFAKLKQKK
ncbi:putative aspartic protease [Lentinula raphanica]|nr:putative aspartic protease [Lentinula raphanica]